MEQQGCFPRRRRVKQLLLPTSIIFCATLLASTVEWKSYADNKKQKTTWIERRCRVIEKKLAASRLDKGKFRPEIRVDLLNTDDKANVDRTTTAFAESSDEFLYSELQAMSVLDGFSVDDTYSCWLEPRDEEYVSMSMLVNLPTPTHFVLIAVLFSITITSFTSMMLMVAYTFTAASQDDYSEYTGSEAAADVDAPVAAAGTKERRRLKKDQINKLLARYAVTDPETSGELRDWFCAICLEERSVGGNAESSGTTTSSNKKSQTKVMLPCGHDFDAACLRTWLRRGHVCPLCTDDLRTLFDPETKELLEVVVLKDDARTATPHQSQPLGQPPGGDAAANTSGVANPAGLIPERSNHDSNRCSSAHQEEDTTPERSRAQHLPHATNAPTDD